jgi:tetratricopeptide (TPR) repeat protein
MDVLGTVWKGEESGECEAARRDEVHQRFDKPAADAASGMGRINGERPQDKDAAPIHADDAADNPAVGFSDKAGPRIGGPADADHLRIAAESARIGQGELGAECQAVDAIGLGKVLAPHGSDMDASCGHRQKLPETSCAANRDGRIGAAAIEAALQHIEAAINRQPDRAILHANRGLILHYLGRLSDALASYDRAVALMPENADFENGRGSVLLALGHAAAAVASYDRTIALAPSRGDAYYNRGNALHASGRPEAALAAYDDAIARGLNLVEVHTNRGLVLQDLNRHDDALASFDRALQLKPDSVVALNGRCRRDRRIHGSYPRCTGPAGGLF